jgi:DNA-binding HxlR family transcriptional regulator
MNATAHYAHSVLRERIAEHVFPHWLYRLTTKGEALRALCEILT